MTYNIIRILCRKATSQNSAEEKMGKKKNPPPSFSVSYLLHIKDVQLQYHDGKAHTKTSLLGIDIFARNCPDTSKNEKLEHSTVTC